MKYTIEFELPDNDTVKKGIKTAFVAWSVWGYSGFTHAKPMPPAQPEIICCEDCMHNGSIDTDCPIVWNGKEYCSFAER